jgi:Uma2 family endonuclease
MTLEEFFDFEGRNEGRYEYVNGLVFAITGPTVVHERIRQRLATAFSIHMRGKPCEVFSGGAKVLIQQDETQICYYPDVMVDCRRDSWDERFVRYPKLVIEILSPSTQHIDRREKLQNYRLIDSVEEYVLVTQHERKMIVYRRADGWGQLVCSGPDGDVEFRSINLVLTLREVYDDILEP